MGSTCFKCFKSHSCNCEYDLKVQEIDGLPDDWVLFDNFVMIEPPDYLLHENGLDLFSQKET